MKKASVLKQASLPIFEAILETWGYLTDSDKLIIKNNPKNELFAVISVGENREIGVHLTLEKSLATHVIRTDLDGKPFGRVTELSNYRGR